MLVNKDDEVVLVIEIEEIASLGPKKILGVLMAILLSENFTFGGKKYVPTHDTVYICAGKSNPRGFNKMKIQNEIKPRIQRLISTSNEIAIQSVLYVLEGNINDVLSAVEEQTRKVLNSQYGKRATDS